MARRLISTYMMESRRIETANGSRTDEDNVNGTLPIVTTLLAYDIKYRVFVTEWNKMVTHLDGSPCPDLEVAIPAVGAWLEVT